MFLVFTLLIQPHTLAKMAVSYDRFVWRQFNPGRWERDVDEVEQFYTSLSKAYIGSGRIYFGMTGHISYTITIEKENDRPSTEQRIQETLQKAWLHLRYTHPTIASCGLFHQTTTSRQTLCSGLIMILSMALTNYTSGTVSFTTHRRPTTKGQAISYHDSAMNGRI